MQWPRAGRRGTGTVRPSQTHTAVASYCHWLLATGCWPLARDHQDECSCELRWGGRAGQVWQWWGVQPLINNAHHRPHKTERSFDLNYGGKGVLKYAKTMFELGQQSILESPRVRPVDVRVAAAVLSVSQSHCSMHCTALHCTALHCTLARLASIGDTASLSVPAPVASAGIASLCEPGAERLGSG